MNLENIYKTFYKVLQTLPDGPLFSKLEINPTELCNRTCSFCPRGQGYPNKNEHISLEVINKIHDDLKELEYKGLIEICGSGEPLLSKNLLPLINKLKEFNLLMTTNGDRLTVKKIKELHKNGVNYFIVSLYDGEEQISDFKDKFLKANISTDNYWLRKSWVEHDHFNNRAGSIGDYNKMLETTPCNILHYQLDVTINGNVEFCCHTAWKNDHYHGNILSSSLKEIWYGKKMQMYRKLLEKGRKHKPCKSCSVGGTRYGQEFVEKWNEVSKINNPEQSLKKTI